MCNSKRQCLGVSLYGGVFRTGSPRASSARRCICSPCRPIWAARPLGWRLRSAATENRKWQLVRFLTSSNSTLFFGLIIFSTHNMFKSVFSVWFSPALWERCPGPLVSRSEWSQTSSPPSDSGMSSGPWLTEWREKNIFLRKLALRC